MIERAFYHYMLWEDWQNGLYRTDGTDDAMRLTQLSINLLGDPVAFESAARAVLERWPIATEVNLTNRAENRRAWMGRASCCLNHGAPEYATRPGWFMLTEQQQDAANAVADSLIEEWEKRYAETQIRNGRTHRRKGSHRLDVRQVRPHLRQLLWWEGLDGYAALGDG